MNLQRWFITGVAKRGLDVLCRIDKAELKKVPHHGPLIVFTNHTGSIEVPLIFSQLQPRPLTGLAKIETWDNAFMGWLFTLWGAIPIRRGEADMKALNQSLTVLKQGAILGISPEGTRNKTGALLRARPGITTLALHSNAPLIPIAHWGGENFRDNLKRLRRTDFHIRVGRIFTLDSRSEKVTKVVRQQMVDEIMYQLAGLMPEEYRGAYRNLIAATTKYIHFA